MIHKTCSVNYGHLADLQKNPTTDRNKKNFHLIKHLLTTFIFFLSFQSVLVHIRGWAQIHTYVQLPPIIDIPYSSMTFVYFTWAYELIANQQIPLVKTVAKIRGSLFLAISVVESLLICSWLSFKIGTVACNDITYCGKYHECVLQRHACVNIQS